MIPKISRGDRMSGLLVYLAGPGRQNEHEDIRLVAASDLIVSHEPGTALSVEQARALAREMDVPRNSFDVSVPKGHVFHCSLSLRADEGEQTAERWAAIASEFVERMGFTESSGKAPCRWVAVQHGKSAAGNDHIHLAVSVIREDGTRWSDHNDRVNAQKAARDLEEKYGLFRVGGLNAERGFNRAEKEKARAQGLPELGRDTLQRKVRAAAGASQDEAEFVRRLRGTGVLVRPRFAKGRTDVVEGFSVAMKRQQRGERPIWFGGGRLARDLTLPKLRADWPDTPDGSGLAAGEWLAASKNDRVVAPGREALTPTADQWETYSAEIGALYDRLKDVPVDDRVAWAQVARDTSGALSAWSIRTEATPGPLADAAQALSRSAQLRDFKTRQNHAPLPSTKGAGMLLMQASVGPSTRAGEALLFAQLMKTAGAVQGMQQAAGNLHDANRIRTSTERALEAVHARSTPTAVETTRPANRWVDAAAEQLHEPVTATPVAPPAEKPARELTEQEKHYETLMRLRQASFGGLSNAPKPTKKPAPTEATKSHTGPDKSNEKNRGKKP